MGIGAIAIQTSQKKEPNNGPPFTVNSAHRGTSIEAGTGQIVLGQPVGAVGNPANVDIPMEIPIDFFGAGATIAMFDTTLPTLQITFRGGSLGIVGDGLNDPLDAMIDLSDVTDLGSRFQIQHISTGLFGIGGMIGCAFNNKWGANLSVMPTAGLHVGQGQATALFGQMKFESCINLLTVPEPGVTEFQTPNLFFTRVATRENFLIGNSGAAAPATVAAGAVTNRYGGATNFLGDPVSWVGVTLSGVAFKIPLYT